MESFNRRCRNDATDNAEREFRQAVRVLHSRSWQRQPQRHDC